MERIENSITLQEKSILNVPLQLYQKDFIFVVNGKEYYTTKTIADLLSRKISNLHINDPTIDHIKINTKEKGDFTYFLNLIYFNKVKIPDSQIPFISEIIQTLENDYIIIHSKDEGIEITKDNVIRLILKHEQFRNYYSNCLQKEINFASRHLYEILNDQKDELRKLSFTTLEQIINNSNIRIESEDQLITFLNHLCHNTRKKEFYELYQYIEFCNVSELKIDEFLSTFDLNCINTSIWRSLSQRLRNKIVKNEEFTFENNRYSDKIFPVKNGNEFDGIFSYLMKISNGNIKDVVNLYCSTFEKGYNPEFAFDFNDHKKRFASQNLPNSYITIDFKDHPVILTDYKLQTYDYRQNDSHLRSWKIQGSNDNINWEDIDIANKNCDKLNGYLRCRLFSIPKENVKKFKYIKLLQYEPNWGGNNWLTLSSIEFYGSLTNFD